MIKVEDHNRTLKLTKKQIQEGARPDSVSLIINEEDLPNRNGMVSLSKDNRVLGEGIMSKEKNNQVAAGGGKAQRQETRGVNRVRAGRRSLYKSHEK